MAGPQVLNRIAAALRGQRCLTRRAQPCSFRARRWNLTGRSRSGAGRPGGQASASAAELAPSCAAELKVVGAWAGAPPTISRCCCRSSMAICSLGVLGYALNGIVNAYPELHDALLSTLTPRGAQMVDWSQHICLLQPVADYAFRHVQFWFNTDPVELANSQPLKGILDAQRLGTLKPEAPVYIQSNRFDPLVPWGGAHQLALD
jgi:hypothetical protein